MERTEYRTRVDGKIYLRIFVEGYSKSVAMARKYFRRDTRLIFTPRVKNLFHESHIDKCFIHICTLYNLIYRLLYIYKVGHLNKNPGKYFTYF